MQEYLIDLNGTQAAIRAGYSASTANVQSSQLLTNLNIAAAIEDEQHARAMRTQITADRVLERWWQIATADANELMQLRREPCPKCEAEEPNPSCEACGGEGVSRPSFADTRKLRGSARLLFAGVKVTKEGIEVKTQDQAKALENVARHLGMFTEKVQLSGDPNRPIAVSID